MQTLQYRFGPVKLIPGANSIEFAGTEPQAARSRATSRASSRTSIRADGTVPRGRRAAPAPRRLAHAQLPDVRGRRGEDDLPAAAGLRLQVRPERPVDRQPHDPQPHARSTSAAYITWEIDFVPPTAPGAQGMKEAKPLWLDVAGLKPYPVFDVKRQWGGSDGKYTFPDDARTPAERAKIGANAPARRRPPDDAARHRRPPAPGRPVRPTCPSRARRPDGAKLFRSEAKYWEPAGAVSWDVAMTATDPRLADRPAARRRGRHLGDVRHDARARGTSRWGS